MSPTDKGGGVMIWAILALLGVPLWLCAAGILALVLRNSAPEPAVAGFLTADGGSLVVAAAPEHRSVLLGPFAAPVAEPVRPPLSAGAG